MPTSETAEPTAAPPPSGPQPSTPTFPHVVASTQPPYQPPPPTGPGGGWGPGGPTDQPPSGGQPPGGPPYGGPPYGGPPGGPPPPGGQPPWGPMPPGGGPPKRNLTPIIAAIIAFLVVVGIAVAAVILIPKITGGDKSKTNATSATSTTTTSSSGTTTSSKTRTTTSRTTPSEPGVSGASAKLMSLLPDGYDSGACKPIAPVTDAVATADCEKNSKPGGPDVARYSLFPDKSTLDRHFQGAIKEDEELLSCPGSNVESPTTWHYTQTPDQVEGQVACGTYKGSPDVVWTRDKDLLLADAQGQDLAGLHDWWLKFG